MPRAIACLLTASTAMLVAGCATRETWGDRALPESQRAVIEGYSRYQVLYVEDLRIVSVDGRREGGQTGWPYASSASVPAGNHWLQVLLARNESDIAMCAFAWDFEAGGRYRLQHLDAEGTMLAHPSAPRFHASLALVASDASGRDRAVTVRAECAKEASCRQPSDCPSQRVCARDAGFEFGVCRTGPG